MKPLAAQLEEDIDWRMSELATLKLQFAGAKSGSVVESAGLRAIWTMLYAHYEGFCKYALDAYLDHLEIIGPLRSDVREDVAQFSLENAFRILRGNMKSPEIWDFVFANMPVEMTSALKFDVRLETNSNLYPGLLEGNCALIGLVIPSLQDNFAKLRTLVGRRNEIAHGQRNFIKNLEEYAKYESAVVDVMYELAFAIITSEASNDYLKRA